MKNLITVVSVIILMLFVFTGCSSNPNMSSNNKKITKEAISKEVSQNGLNDWRISMTPKLGSSIEYTGKSPIQDVVIKLSTGITLTFDSVQPNSPIKVDEVENVYIGKVDMKLTWTNDEQNYSGGSVFQISSLD